MAKNYQLQNSTNQNFPKNSIFFYKEYEDYGYLSNFYPCKIIINGKLWKTTEHYFQAQKFENPEKQEFIRSLKTPSEAFKIGKIRDPSDPIKSNWGHIKDSVMKKCCYEKFVQNPILKMQLLSTGNAYLVENSPRDSYWGIGLYLDGQNRLGKILMQIRKEFQHQYTPTSQELKQEKFKKIVNKVQNLIFNQNSYFEQLKSYKKKKQDLEHLQPKILNDSKKIKNSEHNQPKKQTKITKKVKEKSTMENRPAWKF